MRVGVRLGIVPTCKWPGIGFGLGRILVRTELAGYSSFGARRTDGRTDSPTRVQTTNSSIPLPLRRIGKVPKCHMGDNVSIVNF